MIINTQVNLTFNRVTPQLLSIVILNPTNSPIPFLRMKGSPVIVRKLMFRYSSCYTIHQTSLLFISPYGVCKADQFMRILEGISIGVTFDKKTVTRVGVLCSRVI